MSVAKKKLKGNQKNLSLKKIKQLFESPQDSDVKLAFSILKGGVIPKPILTHLLAISFFHDNEQIRRRAKRFFKKQALSETYDFVKGKWRYNYRYSYSESQISKFIEALSKQKEINQKEFANLMLRFIHRGGKYCLENETAPAEIILTQLCRQDRLSLAYFGLNFLPIAIGKLHHLTSLHIGGNDFEDIPDEIQNLKRLTQLYYHQTPLSEQSIEKLQKFFPKIFAQKYLDKAIVLSSNELQKSEALNFINKSIDLYPEEIESWQVKAKILESLKNYRDAIQCLEQVLALNTNHIPAWIQKSKTYYQIKQYQESLKIAEEGLQFVQNVGDSSQNLKATLHFRRAEALQKLKDYGQAQSAYNQALSLNKELALAWIGKARIAAERRHFKNTFSNFQRAFQADAKIARKVFLEDIIFLPYQENNDFLNLMKEYE